MASAPCVWTEVLRRCLRDCTAVRQVLRSCCIRHFLKPGVCPHGCKHWAGLEWPTSCWILLLCAHFVDCLTINQRLLRTAIFLLPEPILSKLFFLCPFPVFVHLAVQLFLVPLRPAIAACIARASHGHDRHATMSIDGHTKTCGIDQS